MTDKKSNINDTIITESEKEGVYKTIRTRRDVRGQFKADEIPDQVLARILDAAHHAPSVGFMQPWNFLLIKGLDVRQKIHQAFLTAQEKAAQMFDESKREAYRDLKLEGILDSPLNICITCDRSRSGPVVIGRTSNLNMDLYSSVCAVQNLWLAARAEGIGVGWVSILDEQELRESLAIPDTIVPIAYLCIGYVSYFYQKPELELKGWLPRLELSELIYYDQWNQTENSWSDDLKQAISKI